MKNKIWIWIIGVLFMLPFGVAAQNPVDKLIADYEGKNGITTVSISSAMLKLIDEVPELDVDIKEIRSSLTGLKIFTCEGALNSINVDALFKQTLKSFTYQEYEELLSVTSREETIKFFVKPTTYKEKYSELTLITYHSVAKSLIIISLSGSIDMKFISKIKNTYK